jgi:hypothetical protein
MHWKQAGPTTWAAKATRSWGGRYRIDKVDGAAIFVVEHITAGPTPAVIIKRTLGFAPSLAEAQAIAQAFDDDKDELLFELLVETVPVAIESHRKVRV